jgi:hypothetical protein
LGSLSRCQTMTRMERSMATSDVSRGRASGRRHARPGAWLIWARRDGHDCQTTHRRLRDSRTRAPTERVRGNGRGRRMECARPLGRPHRVPPATASARNTRRARTWK